MSENRSKTAAAALMIDLGRLRTDIEEVNRIGTISGVAGINRVSFSDADLEGRRWLMARIEAAGLSARMDSFGNVIGRWETGSGPAVLAGSHLDTVPQGGPFDGTLGVCAALEAVRAMKDAGIVPARPVEVICTADEEGRFGGMLGSQAICGEVGPDWVAQAVDDSGARLSDAMRSQGLDPDACVARDPREIAVFLELHVEQGPFLDRVGAPVGIVNGISGVFNWSVALTGEANHSGTTPMDLRRDAFRGLADFGHSIPEIISEHGGQDTRLTVGKVTLTPNFPHSIAGEAEFSVIGRDLEEAVMQSIAEACRDSIERAAACHHLEYRIAAQSWLPPNRLDASVADRLAAIAKENGLTAPIMPSGAGHDAQTFARHCPAGLIFVPSVGGISHAPEEWTSWDDIETGATLFAKAIATYAT